MWVEKRRQASVAFTWQVLDKGGQVLCADGLGGMRGVTKLVWDVVRERAERSEDGGRGGGAERVEGAERCAEEACEGVAEVSPAVVDATASRLGPTSYSNISL